MDHLFIIQRIIRQVRSLHVVIVTIVMNVVFAKIVAIVIFVIIATETVMTVVPMEPVVVHMLVITAETGIHTNAENAATAVIAQIAVIILSRHVLEIHNNKLGEKGNVNDRK